VMIEAVAKSRFQPGSAKKLGLVAALIRGQDVPTALRTMAFLAKPTKVPVMKALRSAVANAIMQAGKAKLKEADLVVTEVLVNQGPTAKRWNPGPRGMAAPIRRRSVHVEVRVATKQGANA